jgi:hypothetical protein
MSDWLEAFFLTQAIEIPIYRILLRCRLDHAFGASLLTHPIVWFLIPAIWHWRSYAAYFIMAESFVVAAEALYFSRLGWNRALLASFVANAASASAGLLKYYFFGN